MSGTQHSAILAPRTALAWAGAVLIAYVGLVHEVVGARLYPDGPALFGGAVAWHLTGIAGIVAGLALVADLLGVARIPRRALAMVCGAAGAGAVVIDAGLHGGFHFFGATMVVAALAVRLAPPRPARDGRG